MEVEENDTVDENTDDNEYDDQSEDETTLFAGSMDLAGLVLQCADFYFANKGNSESNNATSSDNSVLDFSNSVVQLQLLLQKWEELMITSFQKTFFFRLQTLKLSAAVLQFILKVREQLFHEINKRNALKVSLNMTSNESYSSDIKINFCFLDARRLKLFTRLVCLTLFQSWRDFKGTDLQQLLHLFLDVMDTFLQGIIQNVELNEGIIREWIFILVIPWSSTLINKIPSCQYVTGLNFVRKNDFDATLKQRCLACFRFELFYAFKDTVKLILQDVMLTESPDSSCIGVLQLVSGFWWPVELFCWTQLLNYCLYIFDNTEWSNNENLAAALAEAIVRLPCIYAHMCVKSRTQMHLNAPRSKGCRLCDKPRLGYRDIDGICSRSALKKSKLKAEDEAQLSLVVLKMLQFRKASVHLRLINFLKSIRKHSEVNLLSFTNLFLKIFKSTNSLVQIKAVDIFGHSSSQIKRVVKKSKRVISTSRSCELANQSIVPGKSRSSSSSRATMNQDQTTRHKSGNVHFLKTKESDENSSGDNSLLQKRKTSSTSKTPAQKKAKLDKNIKQTKSNLDKTHGKADDHKTIAAVENNDCISDGNTLAGTVRHTAAGSMSVVSQKYILTQSKSGFTDEPILGRFDAASILYNTFLYRFYMSCGSNKQEVHRDWNALLFNHTMLQNFARYVDGDAWMVEVFKCYLHMLARLDVRHVVVFSQQTFKVMAGRAGCQPWELFAKYRETVSDEIRNLCLDWFFLDNPPLNDKKAKELCKQFFLRVRVSLNLTPQLMTNIFLRLIVKQCIVSMFQDNRSHTIIAAIADYIGLNSLTEFLQIEYPYYYPYALLHCSETSVKLLLQNLKDTYKFDPANVGRMSLQMLHIEMISNIYEHREGVINNYMKLVELEDPPQAAPSRMHRIERIIGASLDKRYVGVLLNFDAKFSSKAESIVSKRKYLGCLALLMNLLGKKRVTSSKIKLYSMLNSLQSLGPRNHDKLCHAWRVFIMNLDDTSLCQMANQLFAGMCYLRETLEHRIDELFMDIILKTDSDIKNHMKQLHFLHDVCSEDQLSKKISEVMAELRNPTPLGFYYQLIEELGHENSHVRYRAAKQMKTVLQQDVHFLLDLKFENQIFSPSSTKLLQNLFLASKGATKEMQELCASCIGLIGALDPRRFNLKEQLSENARFGLTIFTVGENDFLVYFIEELTRVLQGSVNTRNFDICAYCIQEVIKLYEIERSAENNIWTRLSLKAQDLLRPLFTSKYSKTEDNVTTDLPCPIYLSDNYGRDFKKWMYYWTVRMTSAIQTESIKRFFQTVLTIVERSDQMGLILIPYVASYALMEGSNEDSKMFLQEVNCVLAHWVPQEKMFVDSDSQIFLWEASQQIQGSKDVFNSHSMSWQELSRSQKETNDDGNLNGATQTVFKILDHLTRLVRNPKLPPKRKEADNISSQSQSERVLADRNHTIEAAKPIAMTQKKLRYDILSKAAFECHNYARSLMYMEQHLNNMPKEFDNCLGSLQRIYVALYDEDSVKGLEVRRKVECTLMEDVLNKLSQGKLEQCIPLFETIVGQDPDDLVSSQQLTCAYLGLNQFEVGSLLVNGCKTRRPSWSRSFDEAELEIILKQRNYKELEARMEQLSCEKLSTWGVKTGKAFLDYNQENFESALMSVSKAKVNLIQGICSGAAIFDMDFYFRHYKDLIRLQLLSELEEMIDFVQLGKTTLETHCSKFRDIQFNWNRRLKCADKSVVTLQPAISFRKSLLEMTKEFYRDNSLMEMELDTGIRNCYVQLAKLETGLENFGRANQLFIESKLNSSVSVFYEESKMLFKAGKYDQSLKILESGMREFGDKIEEFKRMPATTVLADNSEQSRLAKALLLFAQQKDEQRKVDLNLNMSNYKRAIDVNKRSEKNYFYMACYSDRLWSQSEDRDKQITALMLMMQNYSSSLEYGCNYIYQSLPRLLTIWFDYAAQIQGWSGAPKAASSPPADHQIVHHLTHCIKNLLDKAPTYIFITAFSQLISRLAHANAIVYGQLKEILAHMIAVHPDQVLWMIMSVLKSTYPKRVARCAEILKLVEQKKPHLKDVIRCYKALAEKLIQFTMKKTDQCRFINVSTVLAALPKLIRSKQFAKVLIPFQEFMRPILPRGGKFVNSHNPFPKELVYINNILEPVQVMASLQRPKRITLVGTNGKKYAMMCKPSDDLRKDAKVMEINNMVHWFMRREKESRKRNLIVRTYNVTPLSDTCGILEWIPNLHGYRPLITSLYKDGLHTLKNIRNMCCDRKDTLEKKRKMFQDAFLSNHPVVMSYWFLKSFHSPQSWYMARTSYVRTAAVMSIIGFLMGLGDRHGENILLDSSNGDVVHVDFNCLFNKGETFDWPERVPFRLTRNMINGMGPLGYEGMFRCCCEIVMKIIRNHSSVFLTINRQFVFDPLLEWESHISSDLKTNQIGECNNPKAVENLNNIRNRLLGTARNMTKEKNVAYSVEAHVNYLIKESTSLDNLCQMYIGWAGFL